MVAAFACGNGRQRQGFPRTGGGSEQVGSEGGIEIRSGIGHQMDVGGDCRSVGKSRIVENHHHVIESHGSVSFSE